MQSSEEQAKDANARLAAFYAQAFRDSGPSLAVMAENLSYPFLLRVRPCYFDAPMRTMFVGKETNGWQGRLDVFLRDLDAGLAKSFARYEEGTAAPPSGTPFLNTMARCAREFVRPHDSVVWNNLIKCDWPRGRSDSRRAIAASPALRELSRRCFRFELEVLRPHVVIFGTGPSYDRAIRDTLPDRHGSVRHEPRALWSFVAGGALCVRLRHPGARAELKFGPTASYYDRTFAFIRRAWDLAGTNEWPPSKELRETLMPIARANQELMAPGL